MAHRESGVTIMVKLLNILMPLAPMMCITIGFGVLGFLSAIAIATFGIVAALAVIGINLGFHVNEAIGIIIVCAGFRGLLRYVEQYTGHYIAFRILAILRDKVFKVLRQLAPAKLESKDKGNLISLITSDIELLEVFYAHTIAPIAIAVITSGIVAYLLSLIHPYFGLVALLFFFLVGYMIPVFASNLSKAAGMDYRNEFGRMNSYLLDSLRGVKELLLYGEGSRRLEVLNRNSDRLNDKLKVIKDHEGTVRALTDTAIMVAILLIFYLGSRLYAEGAIQLGQMLVAVVLLASSFGPVVALSNLSNNLIHTLACAKRLFDLLEEVPAVIENEGDLELLNAELTMNQISFHYENRGKLLINQMNLEIKEGDRLAIIGPSGCGKSTLVKLLMRFWDVKSGSILLGDHSLKVLPTKTLRKSQSFVSQETFLFNDTIEYNVKIGKTHATREEVVEACKKASIHRFIMTLSQGYDTPVGELGGNLSSGEKQRLGIARAFLHDAPILILDEPTSNLDTLNEAEILESIHNFSQDKTIIMVSHRKSSTAICEKELYL